MTRQEDLIHEIDVLVDAAAARGDVFVEVKPLAADLANRYDHRPANRIEDKVRDRIRHKGLFESG